MDPNQYLYALHVAQQPQRARMCGFGDKDRRPITPPPCVRLSITDRQSGEEIDVSMLDISFFVLTVDLWDEHAQNELNLVVHPSSSAQGSGPFVTMNADTDMTSNTPGSGQNWSDRRAYSQESTQAASPELHALGQPRDAVQNVSASSTDHDRTEFSRLSRSIGPETKEMVFDQQQQRRSSGSQQTPGNFTRNLIGSLVASAFKLNDMKDELGIWFVLQDLSVRTEGTFRLKFNFVNLSTGSQALLTTGSAPVLCSGFSQPFSVFSAKRFPGMIESTDISRKFSNQGIKIPVRKAEN